MAVGGGSIIIKLYRGKFGERQNFIQSTHCLPHLKTIKTMGIDFVDGLSAANRLISGIRIWFVMIWFLCSLLTTYWFKE